ncbi:MAG: hypothetical protein ABI572_09975 [Actinomycetota bacterium]
MGIPEIRYARSGEVSIAYQVFGEGRADVVFVRGFTGDLLSSWEQPLLVRHMLGLNRALEDTLFLGRAHSLGWRRLRVEMLGRALMVNAMTMARHRAAGDLEAAA